MWQPNYICDVGSTIRCPPNWCRGVGGGVTSWKCDYTSPANTITPSHHHLHTGDGDWMHLPVRVRKCSTFLQTAELNIHLTCCLSITLTALLLVAGLAKLFCTISISASISLIHVNEALLLINHQTFFIIHCFISSFQYQIFRVSRGFLRAKETSIECAESFDINSAGVRCLRCSPLFSALPDDEVLPEEQQ